MIPFRRRWRRRVGAEIGEAERLLDFGDARDRILEPVVPELLMLQLLKPLGHLLQPRFRL
jgi:hypothetical protein